MKKVPVQCRDIHLAFGRTEVLKGIELDIEPGEFFALLGPSGSGKSSLLRLIAGFNRQQRGRVLIDGVDVGRQPPWLRNIGMVFQSYALWPHLSVWDNVAFGLVERKVESAALKARVGAALETVGLAALAQRRPNQLSGGQQQRVALARTIVIEPQVLLLDEPLSNLDKSLRVTMRQELLAMQRRLGLTTIFVTHDQEEAMSTADRMAVLDKGVLQQVGTPNALYDEPANAFVAAFVGTMNLLPAQLLSRDGPTWTVRVDGLGTVQVPAAPDDTGHAGDAQAWQLSFRPHALHLRVGDAPRDIAALWLDGIVRASEFLGEFARLQIDVGTHRLVADRAHHAGTRPLAVGEAVGIGLEPARLRLLAA